MYDTRNSEELARVHWQSILPNDIKGRIAIWYYNLDQNIEAVINLHELLKKTCTTYSNSKSPFVDSPFFEPKEFQYYIEDKKMSLSNEKEVDLIPIKKSSLSKWLKSYSFSPKEHDPEYNNIITELYKWFDQYKDDTDMIRLPYIGFVVQGPLRH